MPDYEEHVEELAFMFSLAEVAFIPEHISRAIAPICPVMRKLDGGDCGRADRLQFRELRKAVVVSVRPQQQVRPDAILSVDLSVAVVVIFGEGTEPVGRVFAALQ